MIPAQTVEAAAQVYGLPPQLVKALVLVESSNNQFAWKTEPAYRYLVDCITSRPFRKLTAAEIASEQAPLDFPYFRGMSSRDTEWWGQQASWGPMQIMGAVAREYGFADHFPGLCGDKGVEYGCKHLGRLASRFHQAHGWEGVAAAYNAGSPRHLPGGKWENQAYVDKVRAAGGFADREAKQ